MNLRNLFTHGLAVLFMAGLTVGFVGCGPKEAPPASGDGETEAPAEPGDGETEAPAEAETEAEAEPTTETEEPVVEEVPDVEPESGSAEKKDDEKLPE